MKSFTRSTFGLLLLLLLVAPTWAQEDETGTDDEGWGSLLFEYGTWAATPEGVSGGVATLDLPSDPFDATVLKMDHNSETEHWIRVGADLARNIGRVTFTRYAHESAAAISRREPGQFIFGELLAYPAFAGYAYDGFADAFEATHGVSLRDSRIDFSRVAFSNSRVEGRWVVGIRKVSVKSNTDAVYRALVPAFPPINATPPVLPAALAPLPDTAEMSSDFDGSGLSGGFELRAPLGTPKLMFEAGVSAAVLVGNTAADYRSVTYAYTNGPNLVEPPWSDFTTIPGYVLSVSQEAFGTGLRTTSQSTTTQMLELSLGARWEATDFMDVFLGFRTTHYGNVITEIRPTSVVFVGTTGTNLVDLDERERAVTYEGFYGGLGFRF